MNISEKFFVIYNPEEDKYWNGYYWMKVNEVSEIKKCDMHCLTKQEAYCRLNQIAENNIYKVRINDLRIVEISIAVTSVELVL